MRPRYVMMNVAAITVIGWIATLICFVITSEIVRTEIFAARFDYAALERERPILAFEISTLVVFGVMLAVAIVVLGREVAQRRRDAESGHD